MARRIYLVFAFTAPILIGLVALRWPGVLWLFVVVAPIILVGIHDLTQTKHSLLRVYPVIAHARYLMEEIRPEIQQYFVETNIDGRPFSREFRSIVYQRSKGQLDTRPFGTQRDVHRVGYEWMNHSLSPRAIPHEEVRIKIGTQACTKPYLSSHLNISAMSFGSLSRTAIQALNKGARIAGCSHNTGEGGISPYHLEESGDLVWQVGTGYFGCRSTTGGFDAGLYAENAQRETVKMIEIKISQGAKPGHGGILPAEKLTAEIAEIRGVPMGADVISPPGHSAFSNPAELLEFVAKLRELSGGKPVGFKLCIGYQSEFLGICKAMHDTGLMPDFITVDGAEGGTGAAPLELSNSVGTPMRDGLIFVHNALVGIGKRDQVRIIAAGKVVTAFHLFRTIALGADLCNSARPMMFAIGCIQARKCNTNHCPVGVATQEEYRVRGLDVEDKARRVANYHRATIESFLELVASAGIEGSEAINRRHILRRVDAFTTRKFSDIYPVLPEGALLESGGFPDAWREDWEMARADQW